MMVECACGCGELRPRFDAWGRERRFIHNHHDRRRPKGRDHWNWKGGHSVVKSNLGYVKIRQPDHPKADIRGFVSEHTLIAEAALGRHLPDGAQVHHVNGKRDDNRPENLVVCEDQAYHRLLHKRQRARDACGKPSWRKCTFCKKYDDPERLRPSGRCGAHPRCIRRYTREWRARKRTIQYSGGGP